MIAAPAPLAGQPGTPIDTVLPSSDSTTRVPPGVPVTLAGDTVLFVHNGVGSFDASERAAGIQRRLRDLTRLYPAIQDRFNEEGVEIMSPAYSAIRDGNGSTIPAPHAPPPERSGAFRIVDVMRDNGGATVERSSSSSGEAPEPERDWER